MSDEQHIRQIAQAISAARPRLSQEACLNIAQQALGVVDRCIREGYATERVRLGIYGGKGTELSQKLVELRTASGLTAQQVATALRCSASKITRLEGGEVGLDYTDALVLLRLYGVRSNSRVGRWVLERTGQRRHQ